VLSEAKKTCESLLQQPVHITGSGAAMYTLARNADHARDMAITLTRDAHLPTLATQTLV
jgi:4-diphosphocytidyl-2C-methyl-D-erythritol kinase